MLNKLYKLIKKSFLIIILLMSAFISILPIRVLFKIDKVNSLIVVLIYVLLIFLLYKIINKINMDKKYRSFIFVTLIIITGILLRVITNYVMKTEPVSDFATPHIVYNLKNTGIFDERELSKDNSFYQVYYSMFPSWFPYMQIVSLIYNIFGENVLNIKIINWMLYAFTSIVLYYACKNSFSKKSAILAVLLFAFLPSHIIYSNITTPDHFSIFFITLWLLIWSKQIEYRKKCNYKKLVIYSILNIACTCAINLFKPLSIFGILVFICAEILCFSDCFIKRESRNKFYLKKFLYCFGFIIICFISLNIENKILYNVVENNINNKVVDSTGLYMLWGYSVNENGDYDPSLADSIYDEILNKNNRDTYKTMIEINEIAKRQFKDNLKYLSKVFLKKFYIAYYSEYDMFGWANNSNNKEYDSYISEKYNEQFLYTANGYIFMLFVMISMSIIKQLKSKKLNEMIIVSSLIIIGYTCILVLGGVQSRYKSLIFGPICFLAASSIEYRKKEENENINCNTML